VQLGLRQSNEKIRRDYDKLSSADMRRYIVRISKGLVEFKFYEDSFKQEYAQFIHESAREFVLDKEGSLLKLYRVRTREDLAAQSYQLLRNSYFNEVVARRPQLLEAVETEGRDGITEAVMKGMGWAWWERPKWQFPFARFAASRMMQMAEEACRCRVDQTDFLDTLFPRAGPYFLNSGQPVVVGSLIGLLICVDCPTLIRDTQRDAARRALQSRQPFGLVDDTSGRSPVHIALEDEQWDSIAALVELYMQAEPRHPQLQQILQHLADTWNPKPRFLRNSYGNPEFGPLLDVADHAPRLATFFLVALAVPEKLEPHLDSLQQLVSRSSTRPGSPLTFLHTLKLFVEEQLPSAAIDGMHQGIMRWLEGYREEEDDEYISIYEKEAKMVRRRIAALLKARRSTPPSPLI
jgi:hypothetical protein